MFHYENKFYSLLLLMTFQYVLLEYTLLSAICPFLELGCSRLIQYFVQISMVLRLGFARMHSTGSPAWNQQQNNYVMAGTACWQFCIV